MYHAAFSQPVCLAAVSDFFPATFQGTFCISSPTPTRVSNAAFLKLSTRRGNSTIKHICGWERGNTFAMGPVQVEWEACSEGSVLYRSKSKDGKGPNTHRRCWTDPALSASKRRCWTDLTSSCWGATSWCGHFYEMCFLCLCSELLFSSVGAWQPVALAATPLAFPLPLPSFWLSSSISI